MAFSFQRHQKGPVKLFRLKNFLLTDSPIVKMFKTYKSFKAPSIIKHHQTQSSSSRHVLGLSDVPMFLSIGPYVFSNKNEIRRDFNKIRKRTQRDFNAKSNEPETDFNEIGRRLSIISIKQKHTSSFFNFSELEHL